MRIYLDTVAIIYLVEAIDSFAAATLKRLSGPDTHQICSDLSRLECRVKPLRDGDKDLLADYDQYFDETTSEVLPLTRAVVDRATALRAQYGFKTPDALHLAAAIVGQCDVFLTNDQRLDRCAEIRIEVIADK
jgi:predicted nucleic acid-binding protein